MKQKLTVTIDSKLLPKAKQYAQARNVSLSSLIEASLRELTSEDGPSFATRWKGRFKTAQRDDPRYETLKRKYL